LYQVQTNGSGFLVVCPGALETVGVASGYLMHPEKNSESKGSKLSPLFLWVRDKDAEILGLTWLVTFEN
jgi:hypothetical protein